MRKNEIKTGMVLVTRNGLKFTTNMLKDKLVAIGTDSKLSLDNLRDDLTNVISVNSDVMKVLYDPNWDYKLVPTHMNELPVIFDRDNDQYASLKAEVASGRILQVWNRHQQKYIDVKSPLWDSDPSNYRTVERDVYAGLKKAFDDGLKVQVYNAHLDRYVTVKNPRWDSDVSNYQIVEFDGFEGLRQAFEDGMIIKYCHPRRGLITLTSPKWNGDVSDYVVTCDKYDSVG